MVELRGVSKVYARAAGDRVEALVDVSFELGSGEMAVISGPSGSGKSTLLRLLYGAERASRGTVLVAGTDVASLGGRGLARLRRDLGIVPQDRRLLGDRTVFGNIAVVLRALGVSRTEARARALDALRQAGIADRLHALPRELAQGERQRLLVARAVATAPRLLLADEPLDTLDAAAAGDIVGLLRAAQTQGTTVLVATHDPDVAGRLGGRGLRLEGGHLRLEGNRA